MILVVGGLGAGKREFVCRELGYGPRQMSRDAGDSCPVLYDLQDMDPLPDLHLLEQKSVVICNEIGCGVVPLDRDERQRREAVGRLCCDLARRAHSVYRVSCGLGLRLK